MSKKEIISSYLINNVASLSKYKEFPSYQFINAETTYWRFNYWLNHKSNEKSKKEVLLKNLFFEGYCVWSNSGFSHPLSLSDVLIYLFQKSTCNHLLLLVAYFREVLTVIGFEWTVSFLGGHFQFLFRILCFFETSTCRHLFIERNWLIWHTSGMHPFLETPCPSAPVAIIKFCIED